MAKKDEVVVFESVGGVDEDIHRLNENLRTNLLDVEIVHL
jgi:ATP-dependent 26S proteasome regulatory subunit